MNARTLSAEGIVDRLKKGSKPTKIIVFTDVGRDIDDAVLLVILGYLHKIGVAEVSLVVANVKPSKSRARAVKFIFEQMGVPDVPVAYGSDGTNAEVKVNGHEFEGVGEPKEADGILEGKAALDDTLKAMERNSEKCSMIVISSLRDLSALIKNNAALVRNTVSSVFFQGADEVDEVTQTVKTLIPDLKSMNNAYDTAASTHVHDWLRGELIPTYTCTRYAAFKAPISSQVFCEAAPKHPVAQYIYNAFGEQEREFYNNAAQEDPAKRFMPHLDKKWYTMRTSWPETHGDDVLPESFEDVQPFIRMTLYDVVAGLICPLLRYDFVWRIYQPHLQMIEVRGKMVPHFIIGRSMDGSKKTDIPDVDAELLSKVVVELLKLALSDVKK